jgi:diguanylate cyclase (GGDEF)-like protein
LLEAAHELRHRFVSLLDSLSTVRSLTEVDLGRSDDGELLLSALRVLMQHQDFARCSIFRLVDGGLVCAAARDYTEVVREVVDGMPPERTYHPHRFETGEGIAGLAVETRSLQHAPDCAADPRFTDIPGQTQRPRGSLMSAPVMNGEEVLAVLNVSHPEPHFFQDWHRHVVAVFCSVLGLMMANHRARRRLEVLVAERTRQLERALGEAEELKRRYEELSTVDDLTGLRNRRFFNAEAETAVARSRRYGQAFSLMLLDLDFFKHVNDGFGHGIGDLVLRDLARVLRRHTREGDILARYGGEEFVMALPSTDLEGARALAERIREHIGGLQWEAHGRHFGLTVSIGLAELEAGAEPEDGDPVQQLVREADEALYLCKANGRNQVQAYTDLPAHGQRAASN